MLQRVNGNYGLHCIICPTGKVIYVGSVPVCLIQSDGIRSLVFDNKKDAIKFANEKGYFVEQEINKL